MTAIVSVSNLTPRPGDHVEFVLSGVASTTGKSVSTASGSWPIVSQDGDSITAVCITPHTFGSLNDNYGVDTTVTVSDPGGIPSTATIDLQIQPADGEFWAQVTALTGLNAQIPGLVVGDYLHASKLLFNSERVDYVDLSTGIVGPADDLVLLVTRYNGTTWATTGQEFEYEPLFDDAFFDLGEDLGVVKASNPTWSTSEPMRNGDRP